MKCILHIGTEKTGTKTIQEFLHVNRSALLKQGVVFTKSAGSHNDELLVLAAYNPDRSDFLRKQKGLASNHALEQHRHALFRELKAELAVANPAHTVVFSSELIQSRLRTTEELNRLNSFLVELGCSEIQVLVYLRRPIDIATSLYSTAVMNGIAEEPPPPDDDYFGNVCNHKETLLRFRAVFGDGTVVPRIHDEEAFVGGSLLSDFMDSIGITNAAGEMEFPSPQNPSLPRLAIELLRRMNRAIPMLDEYDRPNRIRVGLVKMVKNAFASGPRYVFPPELHSAYENAFRESNEWVRKEYFPDREFLFAPIPASEPVSSGIEEQQFDAIAGFLSDVWLYNTKSLLAITDSRSYRIAASLSRLKSRLWH